MEVTQEKLENESKESKPHPDFLIEESRTRQDAISERPLSAIRHFPDELLSEVFVHCVRHYGASPWILAHVSRRFRQITFYTRDLWSSITIPKQRPIERPYVYKRYRHHCANLESLQLILSHSGNSPLDIFFQRLPGREIASALVQERDRWEKLSFDNLYYGLSFSFEPSDFTAVRELTFSWCSIPRWLEATKWERLETLSLTGRKGLLTEGVDTLLGLLQAVKRRLRRLELINLPFPGDAIVQFPQLKELSIWDVQGWHLIRAENLDSIKLIETEDFGPTDIIYPRVRQLEIEISSLSVGEAIGQLELPSLDTLVVSIFNNQFDLPIRNSNNVKRIRIHLRGPEYLDPYDFIRQFDNVEILEVYDPPSPSFLANFTDGPDDFPLCPVLEKFIFDFREHRMTVEKEELLNILQVIASSRQSTIPLKRLIIYWPLEQGGGVTDLV